MSNKNRNYTNYSKVNKPAEPAVNETPKVIDPAATETPEDQTVQSNENIQNLQETPVVTEPATNTTPEAQTPAAVFGIVVNCAKLNIRAEANAKAEVLCVIDADTVVEIIEEESTDDFYAVSFDKDDKLVEGYCMKQYIEIK